MLFFLFALLCIVLAGNFVPHRGAELTFHALNKTQGEYLDSLGLERMHSHGVWKGDPRHTENVIARGVAVEVHDSRLREDAFDGYHNNNQIREALADIASRSGGSMQHVGMSEDGAEIHAVRMGPKKLGAPRVAFMAGIHGDEVVGPELVIAWAYHLLDHDPTGVLDNIELYLLPRINPDGFVARTRQNANGVDLNRNFPDRFLGEDAKDQGMHMPSAPRQKETAAVMDWASSINPHLAVVLHGGSTVCNYPYDGNQDQRNREYAATDDDALYRKVCTAWASLNNEMLNNFMFEGGITNGADWYVLYGGLQDWLYMTMGTISVTTEVSRSKWPVNIDVVSRYGPYNLAGMSAFARTSLDGLRGRIIDQHGRPLRATVTALDRKDKQKGYAVSTDSQGYYVKMLEPGSHKLVFAASGCIGKRVSLVTEEDSGYQRDVTLQC